MKTKRAQTERVDRVLDRRGWKGVVGRADLTAEEGEEEEDEQGREKRVLFLLGCKEFESSSGKKIKRKPIPQHSPLLLDFDDETIPLSLPPPPFCPSLFSETKSSSAALFLSRPCLI
ncbi:hypothetical protein Ancab_031020 [Ancistrocladus abbreviatus]